MKTLRILWIDDDWDRPGTLQLLAEKLANDLARMSIDAVLDKTLPNQCVNKLAFDDRYDVIITDHVFKRHGPPRNGTQIVEALSSRMKVIPPIILLTSFLEDAEYHGIIEHKHLKFYRKFLKDFRCWRRPKTEPLLRVVPTEN
jgi:CheY-like chemotaxis protein